MFNLRSTREHPIPSTYAPRSFDTEPDYMNRTLANLSLYDDTPHHPTAPESVGDSSDISASYSESPPTAFHYGQPSYDNCRVYLGGLPDDVTHDWLESYGARFGRVRDCRIVQAARGPPSGIIRFDTTVEAQRCIDHASAHDEMAASFARVNVRRELRARGDRTSTNLYIANLPMAWDEADLIENLFPPPFLVKSCRILREGDRAGHGKSIDPSMRGASRGVGFCRLETREQCEEAIQRLANTYSTGSTLPLQIRFADTPDQRRIKTFVNDLPTSHHQQPSSSSSSDTATSTPHSPILRYNSLPPVPISMPPPHYAYMPLPYPPPPPHHFLPPPPPPPSMFSVPRFSPPRSPIGYIPQTSLFPVGLPANLPGPPSPPAYAPWSFPSPTTSYAAYAFNGPATSTGIIEDRRSAYDEERASSVAAEEMGMSRRVSVG